MSAARAAERLAAAQARDERAAAFAAAIEPTPEPAAEPAEPERVSARDAGLGAAPHQKRPQPLSLEQMLDARTFRPGRDRDQLWSDVGDHVPDGRRPLR